MTKNEKKYLAKLYLDNKNKMSADDFSDWKLRYFTVSSSYSCDGLFYNKKEMEDFLLYFNNKQAQI